VRPGGLVRLVPVPDVSVCTSLHCGALHVGADDEWTAIEFSQVGNGLIDVEQAEMTDDELSDGRLLCNAADDSGVACKGTSAPGAIARCIIRTFAPFANSTNFGSVPF